MIPADLGLPAKFRAFRRGQEDMALDVASDDSRFTLLSAPTGCGKSLVYVAAAQLLDARTLILTSTKGLQQQLIDDFTEIGLCDVRGQANYLCAATEKGGLLERYGNPGTMCHEGPCHVGVPCSHKRDGGCGYYDAVRAAKKARLVITNYAYWMTMNRFSDPEALGHFDLLVLDEGHAAPDLLSSFCAVRLDRREVRELANMSLPPIDEGVAIWSAWAKEAFDVVNGRYRRMREDLEVPHKRKPGMIKELRRVQDLARGLEALAKAHDWRASDAANPDVWIPGGQVDWVAETSYNGLIFSPVWAHPYAESVLFAGTKKVLLTSATLQPQTAQYLGIHKNDMSFMEFDSTFDPANRPFIYIPTTTIDHKMTLGQKRQWATKIDKIIGGRLDRKGVIHTRSYKRAKEVVGMSRYSSAMITHTNSRGLRAAVAQFRKAKAPAILVSPSVEEGFDFAHDDCRFQIISKVPFIDGRTPLMRARKKPYQSYVTALSITQQVGRGTRAEDDWCETFILDDHWNWFKRNKRLFPAWFRRSWTKQDGVPDPPVMPTGH